jgi:hypothetical protein
VLKKFIAKVFFESDPQHFILRLKVGRVPTETEQGLGRYHNNPGKTTRGRNKTKPFVGE